MFIPPLIQKTWYVPLNLSVWYTIIEDWVTVAYICSSIILLKFLRKIIYWILVPKWYWKIYTRDFWYREFSLARIIHWHFVLMLTVNIYFFQLVYCLKRMVLCRFSVLQLFLFWLSSPPSKTLNSTDLCIDEMWRY